MLATGANHLLSSNPNNNKTVRSFVSEETEAASAEST